MKKLAIFLSAAAVSALLSGCAYDRSGYGYGYGRFEYSNRYGDGRYYMDGRRYNCRNDYDRRYCR
jgi:hypothetical protein